MDLVSSDEARPLFEFAEHDDSHLYFDAAGKTPLLKAAAEAGRAAVGLKSRPWLMSGAGLDEAEDFVREAFADIVGASARDIALAPSTAHAVSMAALNLRLAAPKNCVLVMENQMASNVMPW